MSRHQNSEIRVGGGSNYLPSRQTTPFREDEASWFRWWTGRRWGSSPGKDEGPDVNGSYEQGSVDSMLLQYSGCTWRLLVDTSLTILTFCRTASCLYLGNGLVNVECRHFCLWSGLLLPNTSLRVSNPKPNINSPKQQRTSLPNAQQSPEDWPTEIAVCHNCIWHAMARRVEQPGDENAAEIPRCWAVPRKIIGSIPAADHKKSRVAPVASSMLRDMIISMS